MNTFVGMHTSAIRATNIQSPIVEFNYYAQVQNIYTDCYIGVRFKPNANQQQITKQAIEWRALIKSSTSPYAQVGNDISLGTTYNPEYAFIEFGLANFGYTLLAGTNYNLVIYGKLEGVKKDEGGVLVKAKKLPGNVTSVTASGTTSSISASWAAVNAGGDSSVSYDYFIYNLSGFSTSGTTTSTSASYSGYLPGGTYSVGVSARNVVGSSNYAVSSSFSAGSSGGRYCTVLWRNQGYCPTIGCCSSSVPSGSTCAIINCY